LVCLQGVPAFYAEESLWVPVLYAAQGDVGANGTFRCENPFVINYPININIDINIDIII
jgi:hypothetical protein